MRKYILLGVVLLALAPMPVRACSGFIDCLLGISSGAEIRNEAATEQARIQAQRDADVARIQADAQANVARAEAEVERVRQLQFESEAQAQIAIAQAQAQVDQHKATIAALTAERIAGIQSNADTQIQTLQSQAEIAVVGIRETGSTERLRLGVKWGFITVVVLVIGFLLSRRRARIILLPEPEINYIEVGGRHALPIDRRQR